MAIHTTSCTIDGQLLLVHWGNTPGERALADKLNELAQQRVINALKGKE